MLRRVQPLRPVALLTRGCQNLVAAVFSVKRPQHAVTRPPSYCTPLVPPHKPLSKYALGGEIPQRISRRGTVYRLLCSATRAHGDDTITPEASQYWRKQMAAIEKCVGLVADCSGPIFFISLRCRARRAAFAISLL